MRGGVLWYNWWICVCLVGKKLLLLLLVCNWIGRVLGKLEDNLVGFENGILEFGNGVFCKLVGLMIYLEELVGKELVLLEGVM